MKYAYSFAGICFAMTLVACGGSNSSSSSTTTSTTTPSLGTVRIETALVPSNTPFYVGEPAASNGLYYPPSAMTGPTSCPIIFSLIDSNDIETGDTWEFQLVSYSSTGVRTVLPAHGWSSGDTAALYGPVTYDQGIFTASGAQTKASQSVTVNYLGQSYYGSYSVQPHQARVRGQVLDSKTRKPIAGVEVDFYGPSSSTDSTPVIRGKVVTQSDGTFQASVPAQITLTSGDTFNPTTSFQINNSSLPSGYDTARSFEYNGASNTYATGSLANLAPLQVPGTTQPLVLVTGNNDMLGVTQCSYSGIEASNGWILLNPNS